MPICQYEDKNGEATHPYPNGARCQNCERKPEAKCDAEGLQERLRLSHAVGAHDLALHGIGATHAVDRDLACHHE
jgi:hypothetical protein